MNKLKSKDEKKKNKKSIETLVMLMIIAIAFSNIVLSYLLNNIRIKHDSIINYSQEYNEAKIRNYNLKKDKIDLKNSIKKKNKKQNK